MTEGVPGEVVVAAVQVGSELIKAGAGNPRLQKAGDNAAFALEVVTGLVRTALLPLAVVNQKARDYFESKLDQDLAEELANVPPENITAPPPSVAGPVLQGLGYSHDEEELRQMYVRLLASAMDGRSPGKAHPAFAAIIAAMSPQEAEYASAILRGPGVLPSAELRFITDGEEGWKVAYFDLIDLTRTFQAENSAPVTMPVVDEMTPAYIRNWVRLGLVETDYASHVTTPGGYEWVERRPEYLSRLPSAGPVHLTFQEGVLRRTAFGAAFAMAVLLPPPAASAPAST